MPNGFQIDVPGGGWSAANQELSDISSGIGQWARQQQAMQMMERQRQNELQDAIMLYKMKASIDAESNPFSKIKDNVALAASLDQIGQLTPELEGALLGGMPGFSPRGGFQPQGGFGTQQPFAPATINRVDQFMNPGMPRGTSLVPSKPFGQAQPFGADEYQMVPTEFSASGRPKGFKRELTAEAGAKQEAKKQAMIASEKEKQVNAAKVSRLNNIINEIEKQYANTQTSQNPIIRFKDVVGKGFQVTSNQRRDQAYSSFVSGVRAQLARAMGDVGNLSEYEQKAVLDLVPTLLDDPRTAALKISNIRSFITQIQAAAGQEPSGQSMKQSSGDSTGKGSGGFSYLWE